MLTNNFLAITAFVAAHKFATILILLFAMIIEGESFLIVGGVLVHLGALSVWEVLGFSFVGVLIGDFFWYIVGAYLHRIKRAENIVGSLEKIVYRLLPKFREKPFVSLILAKYVYGTNHATLMLSGVMKMNIWLFTKAQIIASALWVILFVSLGYLFGSAALLISRRVSVFLLVVLVLIVAFMAAQRAIFFFFESKNEIK